jgi:hypothetical protein
MPPPIRRLRQGADPPCGCETLATSSWRPRWTGAKAGPAELCSEQPIEDSWSAHSPQTSPAPVGDCRDTGRRSFGPRTIIANLL